MIFLLAAIGVRLAVHVEVPALGTQTAALLTDLLAPPGCEEPEPDAVVRCVGTGPYQVLSEQHTVQASTPRGALTHIATAVNLTLVARTPTLACHAAVLTRAGRALVVPAPSGRGKTTLTAALVQRGWEYVSDEALSLGWDGGPVIPYPRALALSDWSRAALSLPPGLYGDGETFYRAADLRRGAVASPPAGVAHVVLLERTGQPPALDRVDRPAVLAELLRRSFTHYRRPARALHRYSGLAAGAECLRLRLGAPGEAADLITRTLG